MPFVVSFAIIRRFTQSPHTATTPAHLSTRQTVIVRLARPGGHIALVRRAPDSTRRTRPQVHRLRPCSPPDDDEAIVQTGVSRGSGGPGDRVRLGVGQVRAGGERR